MEASTIPATAALAPPQRARLSAGPLLRLRSDEQLVRLFRTGSEDAFRTIHDRYRGRLLAYARQMLAGSRQDAEDALQDVFVRAYAALRANDRDVSLRAWLYRIAHNRCIDELRRPAPPSPETLELIRPPASDPLEALEQRESLRRLVADVRRLPEQQRSALLMREISGMAYDDLAAALDVTVPAIKSLLVRARVGLAQAAEARDTACVSIREELTDAHDRGVRASGLARRHLHDCADCRAYRGELRAMRQRFAALVPTLGPGALLAKLLGIGGGASAAGSGGAVAGGAAAGAAAGGGVIGVSASHVAAVVAVAVVGASGAVEVQHRLAHRAPHPPAIVRQVVAAPVAPPASAVPAATTEALPPPDAGVPAEAPADPAASDPSAAPVDPVAEDPGNGGAAAPPETLGTDPAQQPPPADATSPEEPAPDAGGEPSSAPADPVGSSASDGGAGTAEASEATAGATATTP